MRILILDADTVLYNTALKAQDDTFDIDPDFPIEFDDGDYDRMIEEVEDRIKNILFESDCTIFRAYLTGKKNYRYNFLPSYKWRRDPTKVPIALDRLKELCLSRFDEFNMIHGEEADDSCTRDFTTKEDNLEKVLGHIDKDLDQVAGEHFNYTSLESYFVSQEDADSWVLYQMLAGDTADCYKGCPQVGGKISKTSVAGKDMTPKELVYNSKAMKIAKGTLCVRPEWSTPARGKNKGVPQLKWVEYHDKSLSDAQRLLTWFIKGYVIKGGQGHIKGFNTTSGFEDNVKVTLEPNAVSVSYEDREFVKNEMNIQYSVAYMLREGEEIPTKLFKFI